MDHSHRITIEPDKRSGQPCIRGLRMTVQDVLQYLASGMSTDEILADFPDLTADDVRACLTFAADRERRTPSADRDAILRAAADAAATEYQNDRQLTAFEAFGAGELHGHSSDAQPR